MPLQVRYSRYTIQVLSNNSKLIAQEKETKSAPRCAMWVMLLLVAMSRKVRCYDSGVCFDAVLTNKHTLYSYCTHIVQKILKML